MAFGKISVQEEINKRKNASNEFTKLWEDSREEYRLIGEMIALRKQNKITQTKLAELLGTSQQVVSRIEKKESSPSLKMFSNILYALGYELKIERRN